MALTAIQVKNADEGFHGDGNGLYLCVSKQASRGYTASSPRRPASGVEMGIWFASLLTLSEARDKARELAKAVREGIDPIDTSKAAKAAAKAAAEVVKTKEHTFADVATAYVDSRAAGWLNVKHVAPMAHLGYLVAQFKSNSSVRSHLMMSRMPFVLYG